MTVRPGSQNARILLALADGEWHTTAAIHRRAGASRLNSCITKLRKQGYVIESGRIEGKVGGASWRYRLVTTLPSAFVELAKADRKQAERERSEVPRDAAHRYRIYRLIFDRLELVAAVPTPADVGPAMIMHGSLGVFAGATIGVLDATKGERIEGKRTGIWIINPWDTTT